MIADYMDSLVTYGAGFYRNLFWEAGLVGQVLYLEAEAASIRSTGIGCYFDDPFTRCSASLRTTGRASTTSRWVAPSRTNGSRRYQRTSWRMNDELPDIHLSKSDRTAARTDSKARGRGPRTKHATERRFFSGYVLAKMELTDGGLPPH